MRQSLRDAFTSETLGTTTILRILAQPESLRNELLLNLIAVNQVLGMWNVECGMWNVECGMWNVATVLKYLFTESHLFSAGYEGLF